MIDALAFYGNYHGHSVRDLSSILKHLREKALSVIYLAGDSSLDNKHWLITDKSHLSVAAPQQYRDLLLPPRSVQDVAYWLNASSSSLPTSFGALNAAVEESTLADRARGLLPQDVLIRDTITERDVLIISVGGNDIALRPSIWTVVNMGLLLVTPRWMIANGFAPGLQHFINMFRYDVATYIHQLTAKRKPKQILVCMIYYPDVNCIDSWANRTLSMLGYDADPSKLQLIIQKIYQQATSKFCLTDPTITPVPLFEVLDCQDSCDYVQRVEPSAQGGRKMANYFLKVLRGGGCRKRLSYGTSRV